mgnify:CR=1 FL=1
MNDDERTIALMAAILVSQGGLLNEAVDLARRIVKHVLATTPAAEQK